MTISPMDHVYQKHITYMPLTCFRNKKSFKDINATKFYLVDVLILCSVSFIFYFCVFYVLYSVISGGFRGGAREAGPPPLFWVKREEMTKGKMAGRASKLNVNGKRVDNFLD